MKNVFLVFPNQLFKNVEYLNDFDEIYLIEEFLFFKIYKFHKQKIWFHRATMKNYEIYLKENKFKVNYLDSQNEYSDIRKLINHLSKQGINNITTYYPADNWLEKSLKIESEKFNIQLNFIKNQLFINSVNDISIYFEGKKRYFQTDFYIQQRKKLNILIDVNKQPIGGKWTYDTDNRLKYPKNKKPPKTIDFQENYMVLEANNYTNKYFENNYGSLTSKRILAVNFSEAEMWFEDFLKNRFYDFGVYEDAMVESESLLNHSLLSPLMNIGLLTPEFVIEKTLNYAKINEIPLNSLEGFIRQIIGWREYIFGLYITIGTKQRNSNFFGFERELPNYFYSANSGILPVDNAVKKVLKNAYNHHIERLMILSNFMLLNLIKPNHIYKWFMEMYIDAYDWVMVPNVYGMGQYADGGLMSTKPYISGSAYLFKMSDFKKDKNWSDIWDSLYWNFLKINESFFSKNPRMSMMVNLWNKMSDEKRKEHIDRANKFLDIK